MFGQKNRVFVYNIWCNLSVKLLAARGQNARFHMCIASAIAGIFPVSYNSDLHVQMSAVTRPSNCAIIDGIIVGKFDLI